MRLIDVDMQIKKLKELSTIDWNRKAAPVSWADAYDSFIDVLEEAPTAPDSLRPKGRWEAPEWNAMWQSMTAICSNCHERGEVRVKTNQSGEKVINSPYCPNCGAKMEVKE